MAPPNGTDRRRRGRARAIIAWWLSPAGNGYTGLEEKIVQAQDESARDAVASFEPRRAHFERDVALQRARDLYDGLDALVNAIQAGFIPPHLASQLRRAKALLDERP